MTERRQGYIWVVVGIAAVLLALVDHHWQQLGFDHSWRVPANLLSFAWLISTIALAHANHAFKSSGEDSRQLRITVVAPLFNEDPTTFRQMLESLDAQTRQPDRIHVIDDGSCNPDGTANYACEIVFEEWRQHSSIEAVYSYKENNGKREAQAVGFRGDSTADVFMTIDSDTVLDVRAIEEGLKPFNEPRVMSAAGLLVGLNDRKNLLTRLVDLGFVSSFMNGRAAWSRLHSVTVNCGGLAFYRAWVVRKHLDEYLNQTVFGRKAASGDDRIMTNFALLEGWTVFQESSVGYTLLPERLGHLTRQRIRWWRSFFWGSVWLIRRFPVTRTAWWLVTWQLASFAIYTVIFPAVLLLGPIQHQAIPWALVLYVVVLSYVRSARYLSIKRPDQPLSSQLAIFSLSPLCCVLNMFLCSVLQYVGLLTVAQTKWGTRNSVEVSIAETAMPHHRSHEKEKVSTPVYAQ